jgi:nucleoside-diphosphate-sugar epimerase
MPAITGRPNDTKVLVTGVNGFIAMWIVHYLLEQGYGVRGTVRSEAKAKSVRGRFLKFHDDGQLDVVVVPDSTQVNTPVCLDWS